jgi:hypothetical protein
MSLRPDSAQRIPDRSARATSKLILEVLPSRAHAGGFELTDLGLPSVGQAFPLYVPRSTLPTRSISTK